MKKFPLCKTFTLLENGPVVLIATANKDKFNVMTISWTSVIDFTPRFSIVTGPWNYSYNALVKTKECVIAVPTVQLSKKVVQIGSCSGADTNKFIKFNLTTLPPAAVSAPLIKECYANIECRIIDHIKKHNIFILDAVAAWISKTQKEKLFFHAVGDGRFVCDGKSFSHRSIMSSKLPALV